MIAKIKYRYSPQSNTAQRLQFWFPGDRPGQLVRNSRVVPSPDKQYDNDSGKLLCFDLAKGNSLEIAIEVDTFPTFSNDKEILASTMQQIIKDAADSLVGSGYRLSGEIGAWPGSASLMFAHAVVEAARGSGLHADVVLGHLLHSPPIPHAWCRLSTPQGIFDCDPWLYFTIQVSPDYWVSHGLAPYPEDYLTGHEGMRIAWTVAHRSNLQQLCLNDDGAAKNIETSYPPSWPAAVWGSEKGLDSPPGSELKVFLRGDYPFSGILEGLRLIAFAGLLFVALGVSNAGGWPLFAYIGYFALLVRNRGGAWLRLFLRNTARRKAFEIAFFHLAFFVIVAGWDTVLPQTVFVLTWIFNQAYAAWLQRP